jgi:DNA-binding response OmpR family regulator
MADDDAAAATVLLVDDERDLADLYAVYLEGYETRLAFDGEAALDAMDDEVDVVLLDWRMPGLSGDEVLARIRARGYDLPVAMLTAVEPSGVLLDVDVDDYFVKPLARAELREAVAALVARTSYDDAAREYFALRSKRAVLDRTMGTLEREESDAYRRLVERLEAARTEADVAPVDPSETDALVGLRPYRD